MSGIGTFLTMSAAAAALAAVTSCAPSDTAVRCATSVPQVSAASRTLTAAEAEAIGAGLTMPEIYRRLGPPRRDRCSGLYCPEWDVADGRVLSVRSSSGCGKPIQVSLQ